MRRRTRNTLDNRLSVIGCRFTEPTTIHAHTHLARSRLLHDRGRRPPGHHRPLSDGQPLRGHRARPAGEDRRGVAVARPRRPPGRRAGHRHARPSDGGDDVRARHVLRDARRRGAQDAPRRGARVPVGAGQARAGLPWRRHRQRRRRPLPRDAVRPRGDDGREDRLPHGRHRAHHGDAAARGPGGRDAATDRRQLHDGDRRRGARGGLRQAADRHSDALQHLGRDQGGPTGVPAQGRRPGRRRGAPARPVPEALLMDHPDVFVERHIGPGPEDAGAMLETLGYPSLDAFIDAVVPANIRLPRPLGIPAAASEQAALAEIRALATKNEVWRSYLGMGYHDCITPPVILRNVLENPGWYTAYTPYQAEIAQGRLEALLNFQTVVADLTGLEIANASLLDEATAAAEAMNLTLA